MAYSNKRQVPLTMAVWLARDTYDKNPTYISGSQLAMSDRQIVLSYRTDPVEDLADLFWARMGNAINEGIDQAWLAEDLMGRIRAAGFSPAADYEVNPVTPTDGKIQVYIQKRYNEAHPRFSGQILSGAPDIILGGRLIDYKSVTTFGFEKKVSDDYMWQLTTYRYLARDLIWDDTATIQFIIKDWSRTRAEKDPEYPQSPFPTMLVRIGTPEECLERIVTRLARLKELMSADQSEIPLCTDDELWLDPPKYAYYKNPLALPSARSTKNFDTMGEAQVYMVQVGNVGRIDTRKGEPKACDYCKAATICNQRLSWTT